MGNKKQFEYLREENRLKYIMANYAINWKDGTSTHLNKETNKIETIKTELL